MLEFLTPRGARGKEYSYHFETLFSDYAYSVNVAKRVAGQWI